MAMIRIDLAETLLDGMDIKFKAPCACTEITGLAVYYPKEDGTTGYKEFTFRDAHANDLTGMGNLFDKNAYVKVIVDTINGYAYIQNADTNAYLNSAIFGTYTHDAENLIGRGENGKFKATVSGTISSINVNGVSCSVKCGEDSSMDLVAGCWYTFILDGNVVNFSSGGAGGAGLNFKVVGGTTEPVSPSENMIWAKTSTAIASWMFSAAQPSSPSAGMVWIPTGTSSTVYFNALKKNGIGVYPQSVKQYIDSEWVQIDAYMFRNGNWVQFSEVITTLYLYTPGNTQDSVTGGWKTLGAAQIQSDYLAMMFKSDWGGAQLFTQKAIDMSSYKFLNVEVKDYSRTCYFGINNTKPKDLEWNDSGFSNKADCERLIEINRNGTIPLDIAAEKGSFYVWLGEEGQNVSTVSGCHITAVWLS